MLTTLPSVPAAIKQAAASGGIVDSVDLAMLVMLWSLAIGFAAVAVSVATVALRWAVG